MFVNKSRFLSVQGFIGNFELQRLGEKCLCREGISYIVVEIKEVLGYEGSLVGV